MIVQIAPTELEAWARSLADPATSAPLGAPDAARVLLLDVRETWELATASVPPGDGYELLAIPMNTLPQRLSELDSNRPVACLCHHGARSQRVALFLHQNGFEQVANVAGGIDAWSRQRDAAVPLY